MVVVKLMPRCGFPVLRGHHHSLCMLADKHRGTCLPVPSRVPNRTLEV